MHPLAFYSLLLCIIPLASEIESSAPWPLESRDVNQPLASSRNASETSVTEWTSNYQPSKRTLSVSFVARKTEGPTSVLSLRQNASVTRFQEEQQAEKRFIEPTRIIYEIKGEHAGDEFGWVARVVGDVDGDDVLDFVATAPSAEEGSGKIYVYSGKAAELLFAHTGSDEERLGNGAAGAGDVDGDSIFDVIVGAPNGPDGGAAYVYSGESGEQIHKLVAPRGARQFGYKVCSIGDVDGDGYSDFVVSALSASGSKEQSGVVYAYSGKTAKGLFRLEGERNGDKFGSAVCGTPDYQNHPLLAVGAQDAGPEQRGRVYVYRIGKHKPDLAFTIEGDTNSVNLGQMFVSFPGDFDNDGMPDVYASDFRDNSGAPGAGKVVVHSSATGKRLLEITGQQKREGLGTSPSEAGDVNGDGVGDLIIGAWQHRSGAPSGGRASLYDGATGKKLDQWTCAVAGDTFGFDAVGLGDVDGDHQVDFLITSGWARIHGPKTGRLFVIAGENYAASERESGNRSK